MLHSIWLLKTRVCDSRLFMYECMPLPPRALDGPLKASSIMLMEGNV